MKKILILSPHNPFLRSNGGENRIFLIMKELAKQNKIILVCPKGKKENIKNIKVYQEFEDKAKEKILNLKLIQRLRELINLEKPDEIQVEYFWQAINLIYLRKEYTLDQFDLVFLRFKRLKNLLWPLIYLYERLACKRAKKIICVSQIDKQYFVKYFNINPSKITIIENPIDQEIFYPNKRVKTKIRYELGIKEDEKFILFFGQLDYAPNVEALKVIAKEILPRLEHKGLKFKLIVCGKGDGKGFLKKFKNKNLIFRGFVNNIQEYINSCDRVIAPLLSGSGTRIKILEALACKKRIVSTSVGAEGIKKNKYLEIEDDWKSFVEKI